MAYTGPNLLQGQLVQPRPQFGADPTRGQLARTQRNAAIVRQFGRLGGILAPLLFGKKLDRLNNQANAQMQQRLQYATANNDAQGLQSLLTNPQSSDIIRQLAAQKYGTLQQGPSERKVVQGADGYKYYQDTGERVLPNVQKPSTNRQMAEDPSGRKRWVDTGELVFPDYTPPTDAGPNIEGESKLRGEFNKEVSLFRDRQDGFRVVQNAAARGSAVSDHALIFAYMKTQDPESVVRESEFDIAQSLGSLPQRLQASAEKVIRGERLTEEQRKDFVESSRVIYKSAADEYKRIRERYESLTKAYGYDVDRTLINWLDQDLYAPEVQPYVPSTLPEVGQQFTDLLPNGQQPPPSLSDEVDVLINGLIEDGLITP